MLALAVALATSSTNPPPFPCASDSAWSPASVTICVASAAVALLCLLWTLLERAERQASQAQKSELSSSFQAITEQHYRERLQAEERHLLSFDSAMRNTLESLERSALGKPKP